MLPVSPFLLFTSLCRFSSFLFSPSSCSFSSFFTRHLLSPLWSSILHFGLPVPRGLTQLSSLDCCKPCLWSPHTTKLWPCSSAGAVLIGWWPSGWPPGRRPPLVHQGHDVLLRLLIHPPPDGLSPPEDRGHLPGFGGHLILLSIPPDPVFFHQNFH